VRVLDKNIENRLPSSYSCMIIRDSQNIWFWCDSGKWFEWWIICQNHPELWESMITLKLGHDHAQNNFQNHLRITLRIPLNHLLPECPSYCRAKAHYEWRSTVTISMRQVSSFFCYLEKNFCAISMSWESGHQCGYIFCLSLWISFRNYTASIRQACHLLNVTMNVTRWSGSRAP